MLNCAQTVGEYDFPLPRSALRFRQLRETLFCFYCTIEMRICQAEKVEKIDQKAIGLPFFFRNPRQSEAEFREERKKNLKRKTEYDIIS